MGAESHFLPGDHDMHDLLLVRPVPYPRMSGQLVRAGCLRCMWHLGPAPACSPLTVQGVHCRWAGGLGSSARLVTCSYDGSVRSLDLQKGEFEAVLLDEEVEWSAMDCNRKGSCVYLGDKSGNLAAYDLRSHKSVLEEFSIHDKKVNTLQVESSLWVSWADTAM